MQQIISNKEKLEAIAGEGEGFYLDRAAAKVGISLRSAYNARDGRVSPKTQKLIDEAYARTDRASEERPGGWVVGNVIGTTNKGDMRECIVAFDGTPAFVGRISAQVKAPGAGLERADLFIHVPPYIAGQAGIGSLLDEAREIGFRFLARHERPDAAPIFGAMQTVDGEVMDEIAREAIEALHDDLRSWGATPGEIKDIDSHLRQAEDEIRAAAAYGMDKAVRIARTKAGVLKRHITRVIRSDSRND